MLRALFAAVRELKDSDLVLAYHDRSDGGLLVTLLEMAFAGHCGLDIALDADDAIAACFAEELGAVVQIPADAAPRPPGTGAPRAERLLGEIGAASAGAEVRLSVRGREAYSASRIDLHRRWSEVSFRMQTLRDNPECAREEYSRLLDEHDPGLHAALSFDPAEDVAAPYIARGARPAVAVLREQGVNSQTEMAAVFTRAGFDAYDVHMTDIFSRRVRLGRFHGLVACGGFSYGDVLGAGEGWAKSILFNPLARDEFAAFFERTRPSPWACATAVRCCRRSRNRFPGAEGWPRFVRNRSEQYEARLSLVQVPRSNSVLFRGMQGSVLPVAVAHGEGFAEFDGPSDPGKLMEQGRVALQFVDNRDQPTERYPLQSQRLARRRRRRVQRRRPRDLRHAAPRARVPHGAELLGSPGMGRGRRLDAPIPQCPGVLELKALGRGPEPEISCARPWRRRRSRSAAWLRRVAELIACTSRALRTKV